MLFTLESLFETTRSTSVKINGTFIPKRPDNYKYIGWYKRLVNAWKVFTGKADALIWPGNQ